MPKKDSSRKPSGGQQPDRISFAISTEDRPDFKDEITAYALSKSGEVVDSAPIKGGKVSLRAAGRHTRVFLAPALPDDIPVTLALLERVQAFEPVLRPGLDASIVDRVRIPGSILDIWPLCICLIRGRVVRNIGGQDRPVCGARVHICEVDRIPFWIRQLPDLDILQLRNDLIRVIDEPPTLRSPVTPPLKRKALRFAQAEKKAPAPASRAVELPAATRAALTSASPTLVREALVANVDLILPYLCFWPHWWRFRCDEIRVLETDAFGRFQTFYLHNCAGDHPDLYFWVEYQIGGVWQTVYRPPMPCNTYWNYACGTEVTVRVTDERVPVCGDPELLPGCQVAVLSIGNNVSVREVQTSGPGEGLTTGGRPFGGSLEPHVWFGRECLFSKNITKYRWSYRRVGDPGWKVMDHQVGRHYVVIDPVTSDLSFPFEGLGPDGSNHFRIKPLTPPAPGFEWFVVNARIDTATAFFKTKSLDGGDAATAAGKYEVKLELFKDDGALVDWTAEGIDLKVPEVGETAPFGPDTLDTEDAPNYYRIVNPGNGHTMGFRMALHVDNNECTAEVLATTGVGLSVDVDCGFIEYAPGATATLSFIADHPNGFATFNFNVTRGLNGAVSVADSSGKVGSSPLNGYQLVSLSPHTYQKTIAVTSGLPTATLLGSCPSAAFSEVIDVDAMATDGWSTLHEYDAGDSAAFALDVPCPECECEEEPET